jgi:D-alanine-D-alanine ligase
MKNYISNRLLPKKVAIIFSDVKREYFDTEESFVTEQEVYLNAQRISTIINKMGAETILIPSDDHMIITLNKFKPDLCLNLVDTVRGKDKLSAVIPGILEMLNLPFVGSGMFGMNLGNDKYLINQLLRTRQVSVPKSQLFYSNEIIPDPALKYPLILKLNEIHGSVDIDQDSIVENYDQLKHKVSQLINSYHQPVVVEEFIDGVELTAVIIQDEELKIFVAEKEFLDKTKKYLIADYQIKWSNNDWNGLHFKPYLNPSAALIADIKKAIKITHMVGYGRIDIRLNREGQHFIIDINHNPYIGPDESGPTFTVVLKMFGLSFEDYLKILLTNYQN